MYVYAIYILSLDYANLYTILLLLSSLFIMNMLVKKETFDECDTIHDGLSNV